MIEYGYVGSINRTGGVDSNEAVVSGVLDQEGRPEFFDASVIGDTPPPLAKVALDKVGETYVCLGTVDDRRVVLHDDFLIVDSVFGYGDTPWRAAGTVGTINTSSGADAVGHVRIRGNPTSGQEVWLTKTDGNITVPNDTGLWLSARFTVQQITSVRYRVGLANDLAANDATPAGGIAGGAGCYLSLDTGRSSAFEGIVSTGTSVSLIDLPHTYSNVPWYTVEMAVLGDRSASFWVDGAGPYVLTSADVPGPADPGVNPILYVEALENSAKIMLVDWVHIEEFVPAILPTDV